MQKMPLQNNKRQRAPLRAIDLELRMRAALFEHVSQHPEACQSEEVISCVAWDVVPKIWPECEPNAVAQLNELATDLPELLTEAPQDHSPYFDLFPQTPMLLLHVNVLALAVSYGRVALLHLAHLGWMGQDAWQLYGAMRRRYVLQGRHGYREITVQDALKELQVPPACCDEEDMSAILSLLVEAEVVEPLGTRHYQLTLSECYELITRYHLETKCHPLVRREYERVREAVVGKETK
jgi:hypothetical protein